jgi:hypothetical protein
VLGARQAPLVLRYRLRGPSQGRLPSLSDAGGVLREGGGAGPQSIHAEASPASETQRPSLPFLMWEGEAAAAQDASSRSSPLEPPAAVAHHDLRGDPRAARGGSGASLPLPAAPSAGGGPDPGPAGDFGLAALLGAAGALQMADHGRQLLGYGGAIGGGLYGGMYCSGYGGLYGGGYGGGMGLFRPAGPAGFPFGPGFPAFPL